MKTKKIEEIKENIAMLITHSEQGEYAKNYKIASDKIDKAYEQGKKDNQLLKDIDLSQYKLAYFTGDSFSSRKYTQDQVMALADIGKLDDDFNEYDLSIALIPNDKHLTDCGGDDWNDMCAADNASGFYNYPKGTIFLYGKLGGILTLDDKY